MLDWVSDGAMSWFGVKTHLRKTKVLGNKVKNRLNSMRIHLNRTDPHQMNRASEIWQKGVELFRSQVQRWVLSVYTVKVQVYLWQLEAMALLGLVHLCYEHKGYHTAC